MEDPGLKRLFERNRAWARSMTERDPEFFSRLVHQQAPEYLWIGCSDARVPANELMGMLPGELFVHRNIANLVHNIDINLMSVLEFAINVLKVRHVIVCGHYGCGGVRAAYLRSSLGLIDNWLRHVQDVRDRHHAAIDSAADDETRIARLCALNVVEQVIHVCRTTIVEDAWRRGQPLTIHGWIYDLRDGLLRDLHCTAAATGEVVGAHADALARLSAELEH